MVRKDSAENCDKTMVIVFVVLRSIFCGISHKVKMWVLFLII